MAKQNLSMGHKKIGCTKTLSKSHRHVTFSKRQSGLFNKASELCTLCGAEIAIVVFSLAGKVFSFGHPNVEPIIDHFLTGNPNLGSKKHQLIEGHQNANVCDLNNYLTQIINQVKAEKKYEEALDHMRRANQRQCWWEAPLNKLGLHELEQLRVSIEELKKNVAKLANKILFESTPNSSPHLEMNGIEYVEFLESKPKVDAASTIPNAYDFVYRGLL